MDCDVNIPFNTFSGQVALQGSTKNIQKRRKSFTALEKAKIDLSTYMENIPPDFDFIYIRVNPEAL